MWNWDKDRQRAQKMTDAELVEALHKITSSYVPVEVTEALARVLEALKGAGGER